MNNNTITDTNVDYDIDADMTAYLENLEDAAKKYNNQNAVYGNESKTGVEKEKPYITFLKSEVKSAEDRIVQINGLINESQKECNEGKITEEENIKNINAYFSLLADLKLGLKALETDLTLVILIQKEAKDKSDLVWTRAQLNDSHVTGDKREQLELNKATLEDELNNIIFKKKAQILSLFEYDDKAHKSVIETRSELNKNQYNSTPSNIGNITLANDGPKTEEELDAFLGSLR